MFATVFVTLGLTNVFVPISSEYIDDFSIGRNSEPVKSLKDYASGNARTFNVFDYNAHWNSIMKQLKKGFDQNDASPSYVFHHHHPPQVQPYQEQQEQQHVKTVIFTKHVPQPYKIEVEKRIPYYVKVPVEKPYPVVVPKPYTVAVEKPFQYPVKEYIPQPFTVEKEVPVPVKIPVDKYVPYIVPKPYPVHKERVVNYPVENPVYYPVKIAYDRPYPVHVPVEKKVPYTVEKEVPYPVYVPQERPVPITVEKPYPVPYEKRVPYPVEKPVPIAIPIPVRIPVEVPYPVHIVKHEPIFIPVHEHSADQDYHEQNNVQTFAISSFAVPSSTEHSIASAESNPSTAINAVQFVDHFAQNNAATPSAVPDSSYEGSVNVAQSVPAPTTTIDDADDEEDDVTELPFTSTSPSQFNHTNAQSPTVSA